jgi:hypothetical protein
LTQGSFDLGAEHVHAEKASPQASGVGKLLQVGQECARFGRPVLGQQEAG